MKRIAMPAILAATVLVAGFFAFSPVEQASTVHTQVQSDIKDNRNTVVTVPLDGLLSGPFVVMDVTTPGEAEEVHIAVTAATASEDGDCGADDGPANMQVLVGEAPGLDNLAGTLDRTQIEAGTNGTDTHDVCIFHGTFTADDVTDDQITDIAIFNNGSSTGNPFAEQEMVTVSATIKD